MINQTLSLTKSILKTSFYIDLAFASIDHNDKGTLKR